MIHVCEYDNFIEKNVLQNLVLDLPIHLTEGWQEGRKWEKARQRILAWVLLAYSLEQDQKTREKPGDILRRLKIGREANGKPYSQAYPNLFFNISHCDTSCACAVDLEQVGIDTERRFVYKESLARSLCHPNEKVRLEQMESFKREEQLQLLWCLKESFVKRNGRGLAYGLNNIDLSGAMPVQTEHPVFHLERSEDTEEQKLVFQVLQEESFVLAFCGTKETHVEKVTEQQLLLWINHV